MRLIVLVYCAIILCTKVRVFLKMLKYIESSCIFYGFALSSLLVWNVTKALLGTTDHNGSSFISPIWYPVTVIKITKTNVTEHDMQYILD